MPKLFESLLLCGYCAKPPVLVPAKVIYGDDVPQRYAHKQFWLCKPCDAYVGCHKSGNRPLGTLANAELREIRVRVHDRLDEYWHSNRITRTELYKILEKFFGREVHIGSATYEECRQLLQFDVEKYL